LSETRPCHVYRVFAQGQDCFWALVSTRSVGLGGGFEQLACRGCVADGGFLVESERDSQVQRVGSVGQGFLELAVDAQTFEGGVLSSESGVEQC
jgi:hypothetical protein